MKVLMDGRNHGAGTNGSSPCSTAGPGCKVYSPCKGLMGCGNIHGPLSFCFTVNVQGYNPKNSSNV